MLKGFSRGMRGDQKGTEREERWRMEVGRGKRGVERTEKRGEKGRWDANKIYRYYIYCQNVTGNLALYLAHALVTYKHLSFRKKHC